MTDYVPATDNPEFELISRIMNGQLDLENSYSQILEVTGPGAANVEVSVGHTLAITPEFWIELDRVQDAILYRTRPFTADACYFAFHKPVTVTVPVLVFPRRV